MADANPITIKFLTGAVPGFNEPSRCHSGKSGRNRCYAFTRVPGRDRWVFVQNSRRDGWWCPDCARQLQEALKENGRVFASEDIPLFPTERA